MKEKETAKLIEIYETKKAKKAIYSQFNANQCWNPDFNFTYQSSSCRC